MFTGLIRERAKVISYQNNFLNLSAKHKPNIGDSIAVNGACLTVVEVKSGSFVVELTVESRKNIATENLKDFVHIEPAMKLGSRVEGHLVQGHIDTIGEIVKIVKVENGVDITIKVKKEFIKFIAPKGSIAIDGVSLTVNDVKDDAFRLTIIPHTFDETIFSNYKTGYRVNIETDMIARYLFHITTHKDKDLSWGDVDRMMALY
ncbi:MAG: riboflavin synthase [Campylobacteraceae bacterium]